TEDLGEGRRSSQIFFDVNSRACKCGANASVGGAIKFYAVYTALAFTSYADLDHLGTQGVLAERSLRGHCRRH
ncbi:MAG: hypothetical protein IJY30_05640, partial [Muribaculaceae bacterium]|nr:hypothetical protein [Muribaculaceae bacterium]